MNQTTTDFDSATAKPPSYFLKTGSVFCALWTLLFILYLPAAKAGFVTDFTGWLDQVQNHSLYEHINRTNYQVVSLYQFTQFVTYVFYKLFGINVWLWHLLFLTLHAINATLLYLFTRRLLGDAGIRNSAVVSLAGALLFCVSPYVSEVIVWEPSFHYLQGLLFILLILVYVQRFVHTGKKKYALLAAFVYSLSLFSLEVFYTTPWLVLALAVFYGGNTQPGKKVFRQVAVYFFTPMLLLFILRLIGFRLAYGGWVSRIGSETVLRVQIASFGKPIKYLFHLLFMGRFFSHEVRQSVYSFCDSTKCIVAFYAIILLAFAYIAVRFRHMGGKAKVAGLFFVWTGITLALLVPLWFYDIQLVLYDRYTYFTAGFLYMFLAIIGSFITLNYIKIMLFAGYALVNLRFAIKANRYWGKSSRVVSELLHNIPDPGDKTLILLNLPESMNGIAMIGANRTSEYKLMHNLLIDKKLNGNVEDVIAYNMLTPSDGAHVTVINDSTIKVTLNQWGTWWWGENYENTDYRLNIVDVGHVYELTLKQPAQRYMLLFEVGDKWKEVDMSKQNTDQY